MENYQVPSMEELVARYQQGGWGDLTNQEIFILSEYLLIQSKS